MVTRLNAQMSFRWHRGTKRETLRFMLDEKRCTMRELADALAADWRGHEKLLEEIQDEIIARLVASVR